MPEQIIGMQALQARLRAVGGVQANEALLRRLALATVREAKFLVPRKTGNLGRSIHVASVSGTEAVVAASASYAGFVEFGTRGGQIITPKNARVLAWPLGGAGGPNARLTGRARKGVGRGGMGFAMRVVRGATPRQPFMFPGAQKAVSSSHLADSVIAAWNGAA